MPDRARIPATPAGGGRRRRPRRRSPTRPAPRRPAPASSMAWGQLRLGLEGRPAQGSPASWQRTSVIGPALGQVQLPVHQRHPTPAAAYGQEHRRPGSSRACRPCPCTGRWTPAELVTLLHKAGLVHHQYPRRVAQAARPRSRGGRRGPRRASQPAPIQQPLHPIRRHLTGLFGQPPAILALNLRSAGHCRYRRRPAAHLHAPKPPHRCAGAAPPARLPMLAPASQPPRPRRSATPSGLDACAIAPSLVRKAGNLPQQTATVGLGVCQPRQQAAPRPAAANGLGAQSRPVEHRQADDAVARGAAIAKGRYRRRDSDPLG